jgi:hypothetical protein
MCVKVRERTLEEGKLLFRAKALTDIVLAAVEKPEPPLLTEEVENEQDDEEDQDES